MSSSSDDVSLEIQHIMNRNRLNDLNRFLKKRQCLNTTNAYLIYLFHLFQSAGILTTSFATGSNNTVLIWVGVTLNFLASLISIYEKTNNSILKKLLTDIKSIRDGTYVDEGELIETDNFSAQNNSQNKVSPIMKKNNSSSELYNTNDVVTQMLSKITQEYKTLNVQSSDPKDML